MARDSMVVYRSWWDAVAELPSDIRQEVVCAAVEYGLNSVVTTELSPVAKAMFALIKPQIDANNAKYENGKKGASFGVLGGRPKNPKETPNITPDQTPKKHQENPKHNPKKTPIMYNVLCNNTNNSLSLSLSLDGKEGGVTATEREKIFELFYFRNCQQPNVEVERFINHYEANGWCRNGSSRPVKNKYALAKSWKFENDKPRYDTFTAKVLNEKIYPAIIEIGDSNITQELDKWLIRIEPCDDGKIRITAKKKSVVDVIESYAKIFAKSIPEGWCYAVLKESA